MESAERDSLVMPSREDMVVEAVARLETAGLRSQLVKLDTRTLQDLCLRLADRHLTVKQAHEWLNVELGGSADEPLVDDNAVYRFASQFRRIYGQVRAEHARHVARLTVAHATSGNIRDTIKVAQARIIEMTTQALVEADSLEDLGKAVTVATAAIRNAQRSDLEERDLARLQTETQAKLRLAEQKLSELPAKVKAVQTRIDDIAKLSKKGQSIDPSIFAQIRAELGGLAPTTQEAA